MQLLRTALAALYLESGQDAASEKLVRQTIALQVRTSQTDSSEGAYALDVLACLYARHNKLALAERTERQALSVLQAISGSVSLAIAVSSLHMSMFLNARKGAAEALPYAERAIAIIEVSPEPQPYLKSSAHMSLALTYVGLGRRHEAEAESERAVQLLEAFFGPHHFQTGRALLAQATVLRRLNLKKQARTAQEMGNQIVEENRKQNHLGDTIPVESLLPVH